jgi:hypothetical protein
MDLSIFATEIPWTSVLGAELSAKVDIRDKEKRTQAAAITPLDVRVIEILLSIINLLRTLPSHVRVWDQFKSPQTWDGVIGNDMLSF